MDQTDVFRKVQRGFLDESECVSLIALAESTGFDAAGVRTNSGRKSMPQIRNNQRTVCTHPDWVSRLWQRLQRLDLPELDGQRAVALPRELRFYKYDPGERFKMHKDGPWQEDGLTSRLTALVYLNCGFTGGETLFRDEAVVPDTGMLLLFEHPTWHEGAALIAGTKYVLRTDVMYR